MRRRQAYTELSIDRNTLRGKVDVTKIRYSARQPSAGNAAVKAVQDAAALYDVPCYRMQSRVLTVKGAGGRDRPMFMGQWTDSMGIVHTKGMSDLLLTPRIRLYGTGMLLPVIVCVPLWVEVKAGRDQLREDQNAFRDHVEAKGAFWLCCHNSCDELIAFFKAHGVQR